jgi:hypothetical protein
MAALGTSQAPHIVDDFLLFHKRQFVSSLFPRYRLAVDLSTSFATQHHMGGWFQFFRPAPDDIRRTTHDIAVTCRNKEAVRVELFWRQPAGGQSKKRVQLIQVSIGLQQSVAQGNVFPDEKTCVSPISGSPVDFHF